MSKPVEEKRIITCTYRGFIYQLGQVGPIVHPVAVPYSKVRSLISMGAQVYEYDPATGKSILLTLENIADPNRWKNDDATPPMPVVKPGVTKLPEPVSENIVSESNESSDQDSEDIEGTTSDESNSDEIDPNANLYNNSDLTTEEFLAKFQIPMSDDGKVDESKILWNQLSNKKRRALREKVDSMNKD